MKYYRKKEYTPPARCFSNCVYCGRGGRIKEMWSIYLKRDTFSSTRLLYHACDDCLKKHLEKNGGGYASMAGLSGKEAKEAVNQSLELKRLKKLVEKLEADQIKHCITCQSLVRHDCYTLFSCPMLGYVDPERDGCTKHQERRSHHEVKIID